MMDHNNEGWICTDPDQFQFCLKIDENTFRYREYNWFNVDEHITNENLILDIAEADVTNWEDLVINITTYTDEQIQNHISAYYDSVEQIKENYGSDWKQIVAECIFEQESGIY